MPIAFFVFFFLGCASGALLCFVYFLKRLRRVQVQQQISTNAQKKDEVQKLSINEYLREKFLTSSPFAILWCVVDSNKKIVLKHEAFAHVAVFPASAYALQLFRNTEVETCIDCALRENKADYLWNMAFLDTHWDVHVIPWVCNIEDESLQVFDKRVQREETFALVACMPTTKVRCHGSEEMEEEFLQNVAHEIKNPLTSIIGFAELLHKDDKNAKLVDRIQRQSERLLSIVENMGLLTQRSDDESVEPLCIAHCIGEAIEQLEEAAQSKRIRVQYMYDDEYVLRVMGNATLLTVAFRNVLENAIEHSEAGEQVSISVTVFNVEAVPYVEVRIRDRGLGISVIDREKIFNRFYRGNVGKSRARGGTGLGLAITKKVLELHGGTVSVESSVNKGSTFILSMPGIIEDMEV